MVLKMLEVLERKEIVLVIKKTFFVSRATRLPRKCCETNLMPFYSLWNDEFSVNYRYKKETIYLGGFSML